MLYDRSYLSQTSEPLGIRNNNPGNLEKTSNDWVGKIKPGAHERFEQFMSMGLGTRALLVDLRGKINRGLNSIAKIIPVWAPSSENDVGAYIAAVERSSGIPRFLPLNANNEQQMKSLARAMAKHETGKDIDKRFFDTAWQILDSTEARLHTQKLSEFAPGEFSGSSGNSSKTKILLGIAAAAVLFGFAYTQKNKK